MATVPVSGRDTLRLKPAKSPRLPAATPEYDAVVVNANNNILRQYFNELDNNVGTMLGPEGGRFFSAPYGSFYDTTTHIAVANTATVLTINTQDVAQSVAIVAGSKITVTFPGIYNMQFSVQAENSTADDQEIDIWIRQFNRDGTPYFLPSGDLPGSTGAISVVKKHGSQNGATIAGWNYFLTMQGGDYIQMMWSVTDAGVTLPYRAAQTGPVRPGTSSVVLTMSFVSALPP
jgi:hypothetical protein